MRKSVFPSETHSARKHCACLLIGGFLFAPPICAESEFIASGGKGLGDELIQYLSISAADMAGFSYSQRLSSFSLGDNTLQWWGQGSYSHLRIKHLKEKQLQNIIEIKPVLRWYPRSEPQGSFTEAGIGMSYLSERHFGELELSTKLNFALHLALGYRFSRGHSVSLRYSHFSNAGTNMPNVGFDTLSVNGHLYF
ncbi:acyloxyacyl hydrolase [Microbulbifer sp. SSSA002]|uniref:acyloxyacyl hydrolase n=1 Tax=unclassified Microbulbifer TaxID=2619833 RepID=UPI00403A55BB